MCLRFFRGGGEDAGRGSDCHSDEMFRRGHSDFRPYSFFELRGILNYFLYINYSRTYFCILIW